MTGKRVGLADNWLRHVQDVHQKHGRYLGETLPTKAQHDRLCELNVIEQVANVCRTTIAQDAWERGQDVTVHGWVYGLKDGLLSDLNVTIDSEAVVEERLARALARYEGAASA
jgi:carbonic anhydrase